ncbi:hypothetical protein M422DRAFT_777270, partial [Sphaerobolus stellatus SS14]
MVNPTTTTYPTRQLGTKGPHVSAIGLGAMSLGTFLYGSTDKDESFKMLSFTADRGVTFWDTSDIYGDSEEVLGKWFTTTGRRSEIFLATKFGGFDPEGSYRTPISKPSYIKKAVDRSLKRLQTSTIDLYYQHRVDPNVPIEVVIETLGELIEEGKI